MLFRDVKIGQFFDARGRTYRKVSEPRPVNTLGNPESDMTRGTAKRCSNITGKPGHALIGFNASFRVSNVR